MTPADAIGNAGGCGCTTANTRADPWLAILGLALLRLRRRFK
jgi:MYXO-CTERM domain-containing protein